MPRSAVHSLPTAVLVTSALLTAPALASAGASDAPTPRVTSALLATPVLASASAAPTPREPTVAPPQSDPPRAAPTTPAQPRDPTAAAQAIDPAATAQPRDPAAAAQAIDPAATAQPRDPAAAAQAIDPSAAAAHAAAVTLMQQGDHAEAVARLDLAIALEPTWTAPLQLRAEAFAALAQRYRPSEAFLAAQAADRERLLQLEPGVDVAARQRQVAELRRQSREARTLEQRRRDLTRPAILVITASAVTMISGGFMLGFIPSTAIDAYDQRRFVYAGATMLAVGVALAVPAITLGVLAGRQGKRDSAYAEFSARTDRPRPQLGLAPLLRPGTGGLSLRLRF